RWGCPPAVPDGCPVCAAARWRCSPESASSTTRSSSAAPAPLRPALQWVLDAQRDGDAFVRDQYQNLLAANELGRAFYSPVIGDGGRLPNLARFQFLDPLAKEFYPEWERFAEMCVGGMRVEAG